jgi:hypothetical protein
MTIHPTQRFTHIGKSEKILTSQQCQFSSIGVIILMLSKVFKNFFEKSIVYFTFGLNGYRSGSGFDPGRQALNADPDPLK